MAEVSSLDSWNLRLIESDQKFYKNLNEIRAIMRMPPIELTSYEWINIKSEPVIPDLNSNQPWRESFQKRRDTADELKASDQEIGSCEDCVELLQEDTKHRTENPHKNTNAYKVFDKMPNKEFEAKSNLGANCNSIDISNSWEIDFRSEQKLEYFTEVVGTVSTVERSTTSASSDLGFHLSLEANSGQQDCGIPGASMEESNQDSREKDCLNEVDLKGIAWVQEFVRRNRKEIENLHEVSKASDPEIDENMEEIQLHHTCLKGEEMTSDLGINSDGQEIVGANLNFSANSILGAHLDESSCISRERSCSTGFQIQEERGLEILNHRLMNLASSERTPTASKNLRANLNLGACPRMNESEDSDQMIDEDPEKEVLSNRSEAMDSEIKAKEMTNSSVDTCAWSNLTQEITDRSYSPKLIAEGNDRLSKLDFQVRNEFYFSEDMSFEFAHSVRGELIDMSIDQIEIEMSSFRTILVRSVEIITAHDMFDEMFIRGFKGSDSSIQLNSGHLLMGNWVFDPRDFIDPRLAKKVGFELQEVSVMEAAVANDNKKDSNQVCKAFSWEMEDNMVVWEMQGYVMQIPTGSWNEFGKVSNWTGCTGIFNSMTANGEPPLMPFHRGKSQTLHICPLCKDFSWEMQGNGIVFNFGILKQDGSDLALVGAWSRGFEQPGIDFKLIVVVEFAWRKQVTTSYEGDPVQLLVAVEVGNMQFAKFEELSVDESAQKSECFEEESGVYVHSLIGSTSLNTINIKGFVFLSWHCLQRR